MSSMTGSTFLGLPKRDIASLKAIAKSRGLTLDDYAKKVVQHAIAFERTARAHR